MQIEWGGLHLIKETLISDNKYQYPIFSARFAQFLFNSNLTPILEFASTIFFLIIYSACTNSIPLEDCH